MEAREKIIRTYQRADGTVQFNEWLDGLKDRQARGLIRARLNRVRLGLMGDCQSVGSGVSELKIDFGLGYRVYWGQEGDRIIILLRGGDKSHQERDIAKAKEYWIDYRRRDDA